MRVLVDGSNLLGALRLDREGVESKRSLLRTLAAFARARKAKVVCFFDGSAPGSFATSLGSVSARFTHPRSADDAIVEEVERLGRDPFRVVTSDGGLAARVRRRNVEIVGAAAFARELEALGEGGGEGEGEGIDWAEYFSDPKNRNV